MLGLFFLLLLLPQNVFCLPDTTYSVSQTAANYETILTTYFTADAINGFSWTFGIFCAVRCLSYGIELIKKCLDAPND